jgi:hypothetical protein
MMLHEHRGKRDLSSRCRALVTLPRTISEAQAELTALIGVGHSETKIKARALTRCSSNVYWK